jgi:hypothetical protein
MLNWLRTHPLRRMLPLVFLLAVTGVIGAGAYWLAVHMEKRGRNPRPEPTAPTAAQIAIDARQADEMVQRIVVLERTAEAAVAVDPAAALDEDARGAAAPARDQRQPDRFAPQKRGAGGAPQPAGRGARDRTFAPRRRPGAGRGPRGGGGPAWDNARLAYNRARMLQEQLNREHTGSSYADAQALNGIEEEIATLDATDRALADGRRRATRRCGGRGGKLAGGRRRLYACPKPSARNQREISPQPSASATRLDALEAKRQTAQSAVSANLVGQIEREASGLLRRRQVPAALEKIAAATSALAHLAATYPLSRRLDPAVKLKLDYLQLHRADLAALQGQVYAQLRAVPGRPDTRLLQTEVPQSLYAPVMDANPSHHAGPTLPVDSVSWLETQEFCQRLGWVLGTAVRLPTEDEWRAAMAAGEQAAWSAETSGGVSREVELSPANANGFHDLLGNVAEWLQPQTPGPAQTAQVAGGSFLDAAEALRSRPITLFERGEHLRHVGFRVVVERPAESTP